MTPSRIIALFATSILFSFQNWAQSENDSVCMRWIAIKNSEQNALLFDTTASILNVIRDLVHEDKLGLYHAKSYSYGQGIWYPIELQEIDSNYIDYRTYDSDIYNGIFTIRIQSDVPLVDDWGDPLIRTDESGISYFIYPDPEIHVFRLSDIVEIRIREERYNYNADGALMDEFKPTGISFYVNEGQQQRELFWVSLIELENVLRFDIQNYLWHSFLAEKKYGGFQYMQVACDDHTIRY